MNSKLTFRLVISLLLSALFLWLALRGVQWPLVRQTLEHMQGGWVAGYALSLVLVQGLRAVRWQVLTASFVPLTAAQSFRISNVGAMLVMLLPLRLGEFSRPYLMQKELQASFSSSLGAVAVERVLDGLLVCLLFFAMTWTLAPPYHVSGGLLFLALLALGLFAGVCAVLGLALYSRQRLFNLLEACGQRGLYSLFVRVAGTLNAFLDGLQGLQGGRAAWTLALSTLAYWAVNGWGLWCLCRGFGWELPLSAGMTLMCVLVIGIMMPAGPGFLGAFQLAIEAGLAIFGIGHDAALAYSLIAHALNLGVVVAFGLPHLLGAHRVDMQGVVRASQS